MTQHRPEPTVTLRLHTLATHTPLLPEGFGRVPVTINGKEFMATITRYAADDSGTAADLWMEPAGPGVNEWDRVAPTLAAGGPDGPVLITREELHLADLG